MFLDAHEYIFRQVRLRPGKMALFGTEILTEGIGGTPQLEQLGVLRVRKSRVHEVNGWPLKKKKPVNSPILGFAGRFKNQSHMH